MDIIRIFTEAIRKIRIFKTSSDYLLLPSRKGIELIWFEKIDFPKSITEILLNIRIFL